MGIVVVITLHDVIRDRYGVAAVNRLLEMIGLFYKRAL